ALRGGPWRPEGFEEGLFVDVARLSRRRPGDSEAARPDPGPAFHPGAGRDRRSAARLDGATPRPHGERCARSRGSLETARRPDQRLRSIRESIVDPTISLLMQPCLRFVLAPPLRRLI